MALAITSATFLTGCPWATTSGATKSPQLGLTRKSPTLSSSSGSTARKFTPQLASAATSRPAPRPPAATGATGTAATGEGSALVDQQAGLPSTDPSADVLGGSGVDSLGESMQNDTLEGAPGSAAQEVVDTGMAI